MTAETGGKMLARPLILFITVLRNENELPGTKVPIFVTNSSRRKGLPEDKGWQRKMNPINKELTANSGLICRVLLKLG